MKPRALGLVLVVAMLVGCPADIPAAAPLACPEMKAKRDAERTSRIAKFERDRDSIDLQYARMRQTGNIRHLNQTNALRDALSKDLADLDNRYIAACNSGGPVPAPSSLPSSEPTVTP